MTSPHRHGSSSLEESDSSISSYNPTILPPSGQGRPGVTRASAAAAAAAASHFYYTHPSRISLLNPSYQPPAELSTSQHPDPEIATMEDDGDGTHGNAWGSGAGTPSLSRAFDLFTAPDDVEDASHLEEDRFFVPSYLEGSTYVHQLEQAHLVKVQAQREQERESNGDSSGKLDSKTPPLPQGSHMGMAHSVVERPPPFEEDDSLAPLPVRWNRDDLWGGIEVQPDGLSVKFIGQKNHHERDHEASAVRADHYMPPQCGLYYYEVQIMSAKRNE